MINDDSINLFLSLVVAENEACYLLLMYSDLGSFYTEPVEKKKFSIKIFLGMWYRYKPVEKKFFYAKFVLVCDTDINHQIPIC